MISNASATESQLSILTVWIPIIVVMLAGGFAFWRQWLTTKAERRDRLRRAYSDWLAMLDNYQDAVPVGGEVFSTEQEDALGKAGQLEAASFTYVLLLEPCEIRIDKAKHIREDKWWDSEKIKKAPGDDLHARVLYAQYEFQKTKHEYARYLCAQFKEPV